MKLERINLEYQFNPDNIITNYDIFSRKNENFENESGIKDTRKKFSDDGLFSKRIFGDSEAQESYSCECGKLNGKFYNECICEKCGKEVKYVGQNIDKYGWIDLSFNKYEDGKVIEEGNGFHLIKYLPFFFLEKMIGRENLKNIIHVKNTITINGDIDKEEIKEIQESSPEKKYWHIGIEEFYKNYNEILDYYYELNSKKNERLKEFLNDKNSVFTDKILVISTILRPAARTADGLKLDELNIIYQGILKNISLIQDVLTIDIVREATIEQIQAEFFQLSEKIIDNIKGKSGLIRNQICGTRVNFSARNVISPGDASIKMTDIEVPYRTFLELYRFEIIGILCQLEKCSKKEAELMWYNATLEFNEKIYLIMKKIIEDNEIGCLLNRNPTIAIGSILYVRISDIKRDFSDMTLSFSNTLCSLMNADLKVI